jgi:hypothetical protein
LTGQAAQGTQRAQEENLRPENGERSFTADCTDFADRRGRLKAFLCALASFAHDADASRAKSEEERAAGNLCGLATVAGDEHLCIREIRVIRGEMDRGSEPKPRSLTTDCTDGADGDEEKAEGLKS